MSVSPIDSSSARAARPLALELADRALSLARSGQVLGSSTGIALDSASNESLRAVLNGSVAGTPLGEDERIWIATPARADARNLTAVIDTAREIGLPVDGFVDAAAVTVAALAPERNALVVELGQHHVAVTSVESGSQARRRRAVVSTRGGFLELQEAWLSLIGTAMVKRTRFDPLHDAATEQQLHAALPGMIRELGTAASVTATATIGNERFEVDLSRDQFAAAAQSVYREMLRLLHELRPAGAPMTLVMPEAVAALPALRDALQTFTGCELIAVSDGFAAAATSLLDLPSAPDEQTVRLLRRLPKKLRPELESLVARSALGGERVAGPAASHVLFEGRAHALTGVLRVGRAPGTTSAITLPDGLAGVSRRHCSLISEGGELILVDHSRFGTYLNGERVSERARLYAGDKVRLGDPGVELSLIALT